VSTSPGLERKLLLSMEMSWEMFHDPLEELAYVMFPMYFSHRPRLRVPFVADSARSPLQVDIVSHIPKNLIFRRSWSYDKSAFQV